MARPSLTPIPDTSPQLQLLLSIKLHMSQEELPHFQATMPLSDILHGRVCYFHICLVPVLKRAPFLIF